MESDYPILTATDTLAFDQTPAGFVLARLGEDKTLSIIVRLDDQSYQANKKLLIEKNIRTKNVVISFINGTAEYSNL